MSTGPNYPTRDAPYINSATLEAAKSSANQTDDAVRALWRKAGGEFHGPKIETGTMPEAMLLPFLRTILGMIASGQAVAHDNSEKLKALTAENDSLQAVNRVHEQWREFCGRELERLRWTLAEVKKEVTGITPDWPRVFRLLDQAQEAATAPPSPQRTEVKP